MLDRPTLDQLKALKLDGMAEAFTELTVIVEGGITVEQGHEIADTVERKLLAEGFTGAVVHVEPPSGGIDSPEFSPAAPPPR